MKPIAVLIYGFTGAGKTLFGLSAGQNWEDGTEIRPYRYLQIGAERNKAVTIPDANVKRFTSPQLDSIRFMDELIDYLKMVKSTNMKAMAAGDEIPIQAIILDGVSELGLLFENVHKTVEGTGNKFKVWDAMQEKLFALMQLLDPEELHAHVVVTARVGERRRELKDNTGRVMNPGDPEYMASDYYPALRGGFRLNLPHYFDMVLYIERTLGAVEIDGKRKTNYPIHQIKMVPNREFLVKNTWEHRWLEHDGIATLDNPSFDDVLNILEKIN